VVDALLLSCPPLEASTLQRLAASDGGSSPSEAPSRQIERWTDSRRTVYAGFIRSKAQILSSCSFLLPHTCVPPAQRRRGDFRHHLVGAEATRRVPQTISKHAPHAEVGGRRGVDPTESPLHRSASAAQHNKPMFYVYSDGMISRRLVVPKEGSSARLGSA